MADLPVVVIGGGIGGLAAALHLHKAGAPFLLLEGAPRLGGVIRTETADGFVMEAGPDSLLTQKPQGVGLCRELGLADRIVPASVEQSRVFVLRAGRLHPMPEGLVLGVPTRVWPMVTTSLFSWPAKLRMAWEVVQRPRPDAADESIAAFFGRHFGSEVVERIGEPLLAGIHAGDPDRLSMSANFPRFVDLERRRGSLIRGFYGRGHAPAPSGPPFVSLRGGLQELADAAADRLPADRVRTRWPAESLERRGDAWVLQGPQGAVEASRVLMALPPRRAARLLGSFDADLGALAAGFRAVSTAVVYLGYRREDVGHALDGHGLVVPRTEGLRVSALSFVSTKFPGRAPEGHVLLRAFLGGARDPRVLDLDDAALAGLPQTEFRGLLGIRGEPVVTRVFRWPEGTPQMEVGHGERVAAFERGLARRPGIAVTGAGFRGTGIPDAVADATQQAAALLSSAAP